MPSRSSALIAALASTILSLSATGCTVWNTTRNAVGERTADAIDDFGNDAPAEDPFRAVPGAERLPLEPVLQFGGLSRDVEADGEVAYLAVGARIEVLDVAEPARPIVIGSTGVDIGMPRALAWRQDKLYVAADRGGVLTYDVSTPASPTLVDVRPVGGLAMTVDVDAEGLWVTSLQPSLDGEPSGGAALHRFALDAEGVPEATRSLEVGDARGHQYTIEASVQGSAAYIMVEGAVLSVVDVSDPAAMHVVGRLIPARSDAPEGEATLGDESAEQMGLLELIGTEFDPLDTPPLAVVGDTAYLAASGPAMIVDVAEPSRPQPIRVLDGLGYQVSDLIIDGDRLYGLAYLDDAVGHGVSLVILDVSTPRAPRRIGRVAVGSSASALDVVGDTVYVAGWDGGGMTIVDVGDPTAPSVVGGYEAIGAPISDMLTEEHAFVATYYSGTQHVAIAEALESDRRTMAGAVGSPVLETDAWTLLERVDDLVLVASDALRAYEIERLAAGATAGALPLWRHDLTPGLWTNAMTALDDLVVYAEGRRISVLDVKDGAPKTIARVDLSKQVQDLSASGTVLFAAESAQDGDIAAPPPYALHAIDLSGPSAPVRTSSLDFESPIGALTPIGTTLYGLESTEHATRLDIRDPRRPRRDGVVAFGPRVLHLAVDGDRMLTSHPGGWAVHDLSDPRRPVPLTFTPAPAAGLLRIVGDTVWLVRYDLGVIGYRLPR